MTCYPNLHFFTWYALLQRHGRENKTGHLAAVCSLVLNLTMFENTGKCSNSFIPNFCSIRSVVNAKKHNGALIKCIKLSDTKVRRNSCGVSYPFLHVRVIRAKGTGMRGNGSEYLVNPGGNVVEKEMFCTCRISTQRKTDIVVPQKSLQRRRNRCQLG